MVRPKIDTNWQTASLLTDDMQVHADASNFASDLSKDEVYKQVLEQAEGLLIDQRNWVCLSLPLSLYTGLPSPIWLSAATVCT